MESLHTPTEAEKKKGLVIEHARLVAQFAIASSDEQAELQAQLSMIEEKLNMTAQEIATEAISRYKSQY